MSHIAKIQLRITDLAALAQAANVLGLEFQQDQRQFRYFASSYGDCLHALAVQGNPHSAQVGIQENATHDGYDLLWDPTYAGWGLWEKIGKNAELLTQEYAVQVSINEMSAQGYSVSREIDGEGNVYLTCEGY